MEAKELVSLAQSVVDAADLAKPNISKLYELVGPYRYKSSPLEDLYKNLHGDLGDLEKSRVILHMNHDGFLSRNTKDAEQLLDECLQLLEASNKICISFDDKLSPALQPSASWRGTSNNKIQRRVSVDPNAAAKLRIWTMTLEPLVKVMQL